MKLSDLLSDYGALGLSCGDPEITSLCLSSHEVTPGALFFAYPGEKADGRAYIAAAWQQGAAAIIAEAGGDPMPGVIYFSQVQAKIGPIAQKFYDYPAKNLTIIGVTGTSGKTSVTNILAQFFNALGKTTYVMGTFGIGKPEGPFIETGINTPDPIRLAQYFQHIQRAGGEVVVMEVSSHALAQSRTQGVEFAAAIFTNLTRDHLDYHVTMQAYGLAKERLLTQHRVYQAIFNLDDPWCCVLYARYRSQLACRGFSLKESGIAWESAMLLGDFNRQNLLAALHCLWALGYNESEVLLQLPYIRPIPGRLERVEVAGAACCVIDYAHKPDALEQVLRVVRAMTSGKLFCIFGCGGDRDRGKRPLMAQIAERYADEVCITDDNPRTESSAKILEDILAGFQAPERVCVLPDRETAISSTLARATVDDVVLIAGKGHEEYQIVGQEKKYFSDKMVALAALNNRSGMIF